MKYYIDRTYCKCHPDICSCNIWRIYLEGGDLYRIPYLITSGNNKIEMDKLVKLANKQLKRQKKRKKKK